MSLNPLTPVTNYQSMLNRIFWFTSATALAAVWVLRMKLPGLDAQLTKIDFTLEFGGDKIVPVPGGYLLPALLIGLGSRVFRIHSQLADWLGLRERFEIDVIIHELARRTDVDFTGISDAELLDHRHEIMRHGFYQFVSGRQPQIDEHLIHRALDLWSWFWIGMEAAVVFVIASFILVATGLYQTGFTSLGITLVLAAMGLPAIRYECRRYAIAQVRAIVADPKRARTVQRLLREVTGETITIRRVA